MYQRSPIVAAYVLQRANGQCERCTLPAPFVRKDGSPFLEVHHIEPLAEGGGDNIFNTVAICPNCHRFLHYGQDAMAEREILRLRIHNIKHQ